LTTYNITVEPPAPFLTINLSSIHRGEPSATIECLVDTGADISVIPLSLAEKLNLAPIGVMLVEGFDGEQRQLPLFAIDITLETRRLTGIEVVTYATNHGILGRDVLNRLRLLLDGPDQRVEIL
jgi:predicted aspartyl protease